MMNWTDASLIQHLEKLLFIDIETVGFAADFDGLPETLQYLWRRKASSLAPLGTALNEELIRDLYLQKASLYAEFGRVVCIGLGYLHLENDGFTLRTKVLADANELELLTVFLQILQNRRFNSQALTMVAHNGKSFDFPYLSRRLVINGLSIPFALDTLHRKPWELNLADTMEMWRFGDKKYFASLRTLGLLLGLSTKVEKPDYEALQRSFHETGNLMELQALAAEDVALTAQTYLKIQGLPPLSADKIAEPMFD